MCLCCAIDRKSNISMPHTLDERTLLRRAFHQPLFSAWRRPIIRFASSETVASRDDMLNALLFLGNHHQTPRQDSQCQEGREEEADDERENPWKGTFHTIWISRRRLLSSVIGKSRSFEEMCASRSWSICKCKNSICFYSKNCYRPDEPVLALESRRIFLQRNDRTSRTIDTKNKVELWNRITFVIVKPHYRMCT